MSGAPFPDPLHECGGEPIVDAWTHQAMRRMDGATADEIVEEVLRVSGWTWPSYERRVTSTRIREIVADARRTPRPTVDEIQAKRAELHAAGKYSGTASIADAIGSSDSTVKRVLGDERKRAREKR